MRSASKMATLELAVAKQRKNLAQLLVYMAEMDRRRLYEKDGYSTMLEFCVDELHMDECEAGIRLDVARVACEFPLLFDAIADGRIHMEAVLLLAPHLTASNLEELVAAVTHRPETEIEAMLDEWFPDQAG